MFGSVSSPIRSKLGGPLGQWTLNNHTNVGPHSPSYNVWTRIRISIEYGTALVVQLIWPRVYEHEAKNTCIHIFFNIHQKLYCNISFFFYQLALVNGTVSRAFGHKWTKIAKTPYFSTPMAKLIAQPRKIWNGYCSTFSLITRLSDVGILKFEWLQLRERRRIQRYA